MDESSWSVVLDAVVFSNTFLAEALDVRTMKDISVQTVL